MEVQSAPYLPSKIGALPRPETRARSSEVRGRHALYRWLLVVCASCGIDGCASLPHITPDMAVRPAHQVRLEGASGPVSAQRSAEILNDLKTRSADAGMLAQHLALEEAIAGSPLVLGNKVSLLEDGPKTYDAMFRAMRQARRNINLEFYIVEGDEVGRRFADVLLERQAQGVQVNLIYDSVGSRGTPREFFAQLAAAGINVVEYNAVNPLHAKRGWNVNQRDHRKLLLVDGKIAFIGGINISSVYSSGSSAIASGAPPTDRTPWRDTHIQLEGPVVADFQKLFMETWARQKGPPLPQAEYFPKLTRRGDAIVRAIGSSPEDPFSLIYVTLISAINSAQSQVYLTNAYFVPDPQLLASLADAARRGVDVRLILPARSDSALVYYAGRAYYSDLLKAGVKIYERRNALLHAKTALVDGVWSTIGSTNLDWHSFLHNQELNAVVLGSEFGGQMDAGFRADLAASQEITLEQWRRRPLADRMKETASRIWAYWL